MNKKIELLAPAGNSESLKTAINCGADAVYFGIGRLNARAAAKNFTMDEAESIVDFCHDYGVKAHIALNTLLLNSELDEAAEIAVKLCEFGADALILQDGGLFSRLKGLRRDIQIHASTQTSITNFYGVQQAAKMGFSRVVLGRECTTSEIEKIASKAEIELEVFAHGAMCVSVSGQCLHSSLVGGRSGNRGACAQPCRLPYDSEFSDGNLLSMRDQSQLFNLPRLIDAGVASLKIEGRMKPAQYVGFVTQRYRKAIDLYYEQGDSVEFQRYINSAERQIAENFSRNFALSKGYDEDESRLIDINEVSYPSRTAIFEDKKSEINKREIKIKFRSLVGEKAYILVSDGENDVEMLGDVVERAEKVALKSKRVEEILLQINDTPFFCKNIELELSEDAFLSISQIKGLRRKAVQELLRKNRNHNKKRSVKYDLKTDFKGGNNLNKVVKISAQIEDLGQGIAAIKAGAEEIFYKLRDISLGNLARVRVQLEILVNIAGDKNIEVYLVLPAFQREAETKALEEIFDELLSFDFAGVVVSNIGQFKQVEGKFKSIIAASSLNITNSYSAQAIRELGASGYVVSSEINSRDIGEVFDAVDGGGLVVFGKITTMILAHCARKINGQNCEECDGVLEYIDRKAETSFLTANKTYIGDEVSREMSCHWEMYNPRIQDLTRFGDRLRELNAERWLTLFIDESPEEIKAEIARFVRFRDGEDVEFNEQSTGGHFAKGFDKAKVDIRRK